ncbi:MAG: hypothetical protein ACM3JP_00710, partial [Betaproteobacteria bacterium]
ESGPVKVIHVAGSSGAGKSAVSRHLTQRGYRAVSTDGTPGLCRWVDRAGDEAVRPDHPDRAWLESHRWIWDAERLDGLIAEHSGPGTLFLCGSAANDGEFIDRFAATVLLAIDLPTMLVRLEYSARGNDFGRVGASRDQLIDQLASTQDDYRDRGALVVDARADLDVVVDAILSSLEAGQLLG